ncbi:MULTISPECIES: GGDEF domain-containing protein [unclassified Bradyrhizobium]|uniref:GGDEF domain-containing protein n=1 Tax=unclassified Bradyrhizobium TaxID=2631580 RepID=UPI001BA73CF4|nr:MULTISPECIES: GGDEF domain-containing protein [unclassified Bradyrhizobium]MBR1227872.1 GGDEF domain-containing protein [Bradyrhizobium sp. AUGA SZCCT0176]MBR1232633.1 GGDEF domain-containing protein [Bradyrhizobium sp. AUGA SZCCT0182]MBR1300761.1 GGDEF domain-containing protein [Bradyrhizobium sp. AUGA SZCCT0042]
MSQQGPILVVSTARRPSFAAALDVAKLFPVVEAEWADAGRAVEQLQPAAVLAAASDVDQATLAALAAPIAAHQPYLPLIAVDPQITLPENAIPFFQSQGDSSRLVARLRAALRVRSLHATVMRRLVPATRIALSDIDTFRDATVLLVGRGGAYPTLSVSLGEQTGVVGALSIEAAAKHLNARDIDGIVLSEGFSPRVVDAFLTVLAEDARFRHLPVVVTSGDLLPAYELPNLEILSGEPVQMVATALPLIRQHAFEAHLSRILRSIDAEGLIDARTGLLTPTAFERDFASAVYQTQQRGGGLSVARFAFDPAHPRAQFDGARIISRLMRRMDFGAVCDDGSVVVAFAETDLKTAHTIARRLSSVMRHTSHGKRDTRAEPTVTVAALESKDSAKALLARLGEEAHRAAS